MRAFKTYRGDGEMLFINGQKKSEGWTNWARNLKATPTYFHVPNTVQEIKGIVDSCRVRGTSLRVTGAGHSFSAVAQPENETLSLENLRGLISYDAKTMEARCGPGRIFMRRRRFWQRLVWRLKIWAM